MMHVSKRAGRAWRWPGFFILFISVASPLQAGEFTYGFGYTAQRSDNITQVPTGEISETINSYQVGLSYKEKTSDIIADILAQAEYRDYRDDTYADEDVYKVKASLLWSISPQRFTWTVEDVYEQTTIDPTVADTPNNRTNVNVFSTGPDVYIRLNPVHTFALGARAENVHSGNKNILGDPNIDSNRTKGTVRWLYQANPASIYSINYETLNVNFDDDATNTDYSRHELYLRADYRPSRSQYVIDLGVTKINPDVGRDLEETLARFSWIRELTLESRFGLSASGEYSDTGNDVLATASTATPTPTPTSGSVSSDVFYTKRGSLFYLRRGTEFGVDFSLFAQDLDYEVTPQDRKETGGRLNVDFIFGATTTLTLFTEQTRSDYKDIVRRDTDRNSGVRLNYRLTRTVSLELGGARVERKSSVPTDTHEENRVYISLLYKSSPLFGFK